MDLHDVFVALNGFDAATGPDRMAHRCSCGYVTELVEVMAIHQVRVHNFPCETRFPEGLWPRPETLPFNPPRLSMDHPAGGTVTTTPLPSVLWRNFTPSIPAACILDGVAGVEYWEADQPSGPWSRCLDGITRKRYVKFRTP